MVLKKQPAKPLPFFRDIPVGTRFRVKTVLRTLWEKIEPVKPPGANHIMYNALDIYGGDSAKFGWNAKVIIEK